MRVVVVNGSPRADGNTNKAMELIIQAAKSKTHTLEINRYHLDALSLKGCQGCMMCKEPGVKMCIIEDDGQALLRDMFEADAWILGTPVYMGHITGQMKLLLDRTYGYLAPGFVLKLPAGKRGVAVITQGRREPDAYRNVIEFFSSMFERRQFASGECMVVTGTDGRACGDIAFASEVLATASAAGEALTGS
jgi:multimeric flavodoxin WrbA